MIAGVHEEATVIRWRLLHLGVEAFVLSAFCKLWSYGLAAAVRLTKRSKGTPEDAPEGSGRSEQPALLWIHSGAHGGDAFGHFHPTKTGGVRRCLPCIYLLSVTDTLEAAATVPLPAVEAYLHAK